MHMSIGAHVADDVLEKFLLQRLPEADLAAVEEHLLVCSKCQTQAEEIEEFILVTKAALRSTAAKPAQRALRASSAGFAHSWLSVPVFAILAAAVAAAFFIPYHRTANPLPPAFVSLSALRGPAAMPHARAGGGLILDLDSTGLPEGAGYGVRVVDSRGSEVWTGVPVSSEDRHIRATVNASLHSGRYWVRLVARNGELLREYGLQLD